MNNYKSVATKLTIKYLLLQSSFWMSFAAIWSFATVYLLEKGFQNTQVGIVLSIGSILSIVLQPFIASFVDKTEAILLKYVLLIMVFVLFLLALCLWFLPLSPILIGGIYILMGTIILSLPPLTYSLALEYMNLGIPINFGIARASGSLSFAIMAYIIGIVTSKLNASIIIPIFAILSIFMMIILYTFESPLIYSKKDILDVDSINSGKKNNSSQNVFSFFIMYKKFGLLLVGFIMLFISHNLINTYHINIIKNVGGNDANMGLSIAIAAIVEIPTMIAFTFLITKVSCSKLLKISALFFVLKTIVITIAPNIGVIYLSQAFQIGSFALFTPASVYYVNDIIDESNRVKGQALLGAATMGAGGTLGNFIGGKILDTYNITTMLVLGIIVAIIGFIMTALFTEKTEK